MVGSSFPLQGDFGFYEEESSAGSEFNLEDLSDSFLDFIKDWIEDVPEPQKTDLGVSQTPLCSGMAEKGALEAGPAGFGDRNEDEDVDIVGMEEGEAASAGFGDRIEDEGVDVVGIEEIKVEEVEVGPAGFGDRIEDEDVDIMGLEELKVEDEVDTEGGLVSGDEKEENKDEEKVNGVLEIRSEAQCLASSSESSSSSSSSSDSESESSSDESDDDDDKRGGKEAHVDLEEGEILSHELDEMIGWSDDEDGTAALEPQRSKNELMVLPPVPPVTAKLEPHHQILPVGVVLSVLGAQVIVEGVEKHSPLNEGSILWITKSGTPLGIVDEIFGPVKNPYYIVRYNSESEVPSGIEPGTPISFVPEFADHVLNDRSLYQKGYDKSGPNDEELLEDEEFSDDEKEAEYKKMLKNKKRGKNDERSGNNQSNDENKFSNRSRNWKSDSSNNTPRHKQPSSSPMNQCAQPIPSSRPPQAFAPQPFPQFGAFPGGPNGMMPFQQPQNMGLPQMAPNGMPPMMQQMLPQQFFQMPMENRFPFQQQMNGPNMAPNQPGFGAGPPFLPWGGQNPFMGSPFGMGQNPFMNVGQQAPPPGFQQPASLPMNAGHQGPPPGFQQPASLSMNAGQQGPPPGFQQPASLPMNAGQQGPPLGFQQPASLPMNAGQQGPPGFEQQAPGPVNAGQQGPPGFEQQAPGPVNTGQEASPNMHKPSDSQQQTVFSSQQGSSQSFNQGNQSGGRGGGRFRGGKPHRRGGGRFRGGRGGRNSS